MTSTIAFTRRASFGLLAAGLATDVARAETLQPLSLGLLHTRSPATFYIAKERGFFA
jgi:hypothetical protein